MKILLLVAILLMILYVTIRFLFNRWISYIGKIDDELVTGRSVASTAEVLDLPVAAVEIHFRRRQHSKIYLAFLEYRREQMQKPRT